MKNVFLLLFACPALLIPSAAAAAKKVVFISGKPSHAPMAHEHRAGNMILAKRLNAAGLGIEAVVLPEDGYPEDSSVLEDAATIVVFATGHQNHLLNPRLEEFDALMKKGTGVVMIHWATEAMVGMPAKKFLEWMGGFCDLNWSVNPHWKPNFDNLPEHPITNGVAPFSVDDEWYYHMRFVEDREGLTSILADLPGPETLKRPDGARSGNPAVRESVARGEDQTVAWAYERPDGKGRGFGFTGGHNHVSWQDEGFRKIVLNAILWTANIEVPENGVESEAPDEEEIKANLDDKPARKRRPAPPAKKEAAPKEAAASKVTQDLGNRQVAAARFQELREKSVRKIDSTAALELLATTLGATEDAALHRSLLEGMLKGLEGRRGVSAPGGWSDVSSSLENSGNAEVGRLALRLGQIFGDKAATEKALETIADAGRPVTERRESLRGLVAQRNAKVLPVLRKLLDDEALRVDAIRAYGAFEYERTPGILLGRFAEFDFQAQRATVETLATREEYADALLVALKNETLATSDIPAYIARSLSSMLGAAFTEVYGDIGELSGDKAELITKYKNLLTAQRLATADASAGRLVYQAACASCHVLYGEGGTIGPELTGSNRADLNYILLNMIDPSADIPDAYKLITVTTKDKQILAGTLAQEDDQRLVLNTIGQKVTIVKGDIAKREIAPVSMMPEGLLPTLSNRQVLELVKYLQTKRQVPFPKVK